MSKVVKHVKISPEQIFAVIKLGTYLNQLVQPYMWTKFGDFSLKNESRNAKIDQPIKWSIIYIFNEVVPP